jgi:hypothetical protein
MPSCGFIGMDEKDSFLPFSLIDSIRFDSIICLFVCVLLRAFPASLSEDGVPLGVFLFCSTGWQFGLFSVSWGLAMRV